MHLLAAQPGGFVEEEGIIDLNQDPAVMVILAAADTSLAMLATAAEQLGDELPSLRLANWSHLLKPAAFDLYEHKVLDQAQLVVVSLLGGESYWHYGFDNNQ
jgi:cobaltochelatase CobN